MNDRVDEPRAIPIRSVDEFMRRYFPKQHEEMIQRRMLREDPEGYAKRMVDQIMEAHGIKPAEDKR